MKLCRGNDNTPNTFLHLKRAKYRQIQLLGKKNSRFIQINTYTKHISPYRFIQVSGWD